MRYNITQPILNLYWLNNDHENRTNATNEERMEYMMGFQRVYVYIHMYIVESMQ